MLRTAVLLTGSREAGQDLLQTALERLLRHWRTLSGDPEGYLRRTLYNLAADGFRRQGRLQRKLLLLRADTRPPPDATAPVDLRDGMGRFTEGVRAPAGLAAEVSRRHRRRMAVRVSAACGGVAAVAVAAALVAVSLPGSAPATTGHAGTQARTVAYVVSRVKQALAGEHLVFYGQTASTYGGGVCPPGPCRPARARPRPGSR